MLACDFDLNFIFISCGWEGSASDAGVLRSAISKGFSVPEGKFYLVDGGYANTSSFINPYRGVRYHLSEFRRRRSSQASYVNYKELFNQNQIKIAAAAVDFHNIIRGQNGDEGWLDHQADHISPSQYIEVPEGDNNYPNDMDSSDGSNLRDQIALQMWAAYNS
jgi:hypothetical protein